MYISINQNIKTKLPDLKLGCIKADIKFEKYNQKLWIAIEKEIEKIANFQIEEIKNIPQIQSSRDAYLKLGKEPARYRLSAEALTRRIIQGKGLYKISNIVDVINYSSIKTGYSIGGYDFDKISGKIVLDIGSAEDEYIAIGRGKMNIADLPVFRDGIGAFGSPTSDSERTMITETTKTILLVILNFGNHAGFQTDLKTITDFITEFADGYNITTEII